MNLDDMQADLERLKQFKDMMENIEREAFGALRRINNKASNAAIDSLIEQIEIVRIDEIEPAISVLEDEIAELIDAEEGYDFKKEHGTWNNFDSGCK